jgi:hypothetical protein
MISIGLLPGEKKGKIQNTTPEANCKILAEHYIWVSEK